MTAHDFDIERLLSAAEDIVVEGTVHRGMMPSRLNAVAEAIREIRKDGHVALKAHMIVSRKTREFRFEESPEEEVARLPYDWAWGANEWVNTSAGRVEAQHALPMFEIRRQSPEDDVLLGDNHIYLLECAIDFGSIAFRRHITGTYSPAMNISEALEYLAELRDEASRLTRRLRRRRK